jgi:hypothetical protein
VPAAEARLDEPSARRYYPTFGHRANPIRAVAGVAVAMRVTQLRRSERPADGDQLRPPSRPGAHELRLIARDLTARDEVDLALVAISHADDVFEVLAVDPEDGTRTPGLLDTAVRALGRDNMRIEADGATATVAVAPLHLNGTTRGVLAPRRRAPVGDDAQIRWLLDS